MRRAHQVAVLSFAGICGAACAQTPSSGSWFPVTPSSPASPASVEPSGARSHAVELQLHARPDGRTEAIAVNRLAGPVQVVLHVEGRAPVAEPALPARALIHANGRSVIAQIRDSGPQTRLRLSAVPGAPSARPRDVEYLYPMRDAPLRIAQGFGGGFSHHDAENLHAVDFAAPAGTPVRAARDGLVMQVESTATARLHPRLAFGSGDDRVRGNFIRILHDDGTMALYAHLQHAGVVVAPGAQVRRGTIIGFSGNTGLSGGPHLHFVIQANRGMRLESLPFRMAGPDGPLRFAQVQHDTAPAAP